MFSSELSNALNPDVVARPRRRHAQSSAQATSPTAPVSTLQQAAPHRSELELAIAPPQQSTVIDAQAIIPQNEALQPPRTANPVVELYRVVATAREAAAAERNRRIAWEHEQEARNAQHRQELERQILDMRQEITMLKAYISMHPHIPPPDPQQSQPFANTIPTTAHIEPASPSTELSPQTPLSPISPVPHHSGVQQPTFVQGSSSRPFTAEQPYPPPPAYVGQSPALSVLSPPPSTASSPQFAPARTAPGSLRANSSEKLAPPTPQSTGQPFTPVPASPKTAPESRKRPRHVAEDDSDFDSESEDDSDDPATGQTRPRKSGREGRCVTIHHAMRIHIRKMMKLKHGEELPDSHWEGAPLLADQPVRFVWNKTTKQSAHNAAMKRRIVADIKANRSAYKHVPDKDFSKKTLDSIFDQVFTTLRQKFKAQKDVSAATRLQRRENNKALKARRLQRKKTKLGNRAEARKKLAEFAQPVFETALSQDCMSSEESDGEYVENGEKVQVFRTRGPSWRSARLLRYYAVLDETDRMDKSMKPKRGLGRRIRREGPPKDGLFLPPKGVARWMVSRRWLQETEATRPDLVTVLRELIVEEVEPESEVTQVMLGSEESEDESTQGPPAADVYAHVSDTSYSLHNALQPV